MKEEQSIHRPLNGTIRASRGGRRHKVIGFTMTPRGDDITRVMFHIVGSRAVHLDLPPENIHELMRCLVLTQNASFKESVDNGE